MEHHPKHGAVTGSAYALAQQRRRAAMVCWLGDAWGMVRRLIFRGRVAEVVPIVSSLTPDMESDPTFAKGLTSCALEGRIDMHTVNAFFLVLNPFSRAVFPSKNIVNALPLRWHQKC